MPFVNRVVTPKYVCRKKQIAPGGGSGGHSSTDHHYQQQQQQNVVLPLQDNELETITNVTLSNALRQLASILVISNEIFTELNKELETIGVRSLGVKKRIQALAQKVDSFDPKLVPVPESDLITVSNIKDHYKQKHSLDTSLFTPETRTDTLKELYDAAAKTPVPVMDELDRIIGENRRRSSDAFLCTPVLGQLRRKMKSRIDFEIETRVPADLEHLRKWTSTEAIGDITVGPDSIVRVGNNNSTIVNTSRDVTDDTIIAECSEITMNETPLDHRLPSPEEQQKVIVSKYPAETIRVDVSGRRFDRMSAARKSLLHVQVGLAAAAGGAGGSASSGSSNSPTTTATTNGSVEPDGGDESGGAGGGGGGGDTIKRRSRSRKPRGKRRNTIAGTDGKEIEDAAASNGDATATSIVVKSAESTESQTVPRSKSNDILKTSTEKSRQSHFNTLKQWGKNRLRQITSRGAVPDERPSQTDRDVSDIDDFNINETIRMNAGLKRGKLNMEKKIFHERKPSYSSSERSCVPNVKLRESSNLRRRRLGQKDEQNSSSGNWSASSESGRTSIGSEITTTTHPKSTSSSSSLNHHHTSSGPPSSIISRRRFLNTSASSSITSEGTATPDLQMDFHDEDGSSSVYSCDTEGYYTSFHVDSGLKTLKEEETPHKSSTTSFESSGNQTILSPENEYELFGRGSTSTTTSSAGTVCTTILADRPNVPERKSSLSLNRSNSSVSDRNLERSYSNSTVGSMERMGTIKRNGVLLQKEVAALVHQTKEDAVQRTDSPDSGNNTSSSPIESNSSPTQSQQGVRSNSEFEYSESSDLECVDRIERIRVKTTINTSRIPSMCVITPGNSDDEDKRKTDEFPKVVAIEFGKEEVEYDVPKVHVVKKSTSTLLPLNFMGKLKGVLQKKSPNKDGAPLAELEEDFDDPGEYVTIAETNNNKQAQAHGVYYSNDVVKRNLATVLSGNLNAAGTSDYVSLNELPCNIRCESNLVEAHTVEQNKEGNEQQQQQQQQQQRKGARVTLDAHGKVVYNSDSLKRRKAAHTTFVPGPCIKQPSELSVTNEPATEQQAVISSPGVLIKKNLNPIQVRPVKISTNPTNSMQTYVHTGSASHFIDPDYQPLSPESGGYVKPSYISTTLPRFQTSPLYESPGPAPTAAAAMPPAMEQLQRGNNSTYWTLQSARKTRGGQDDLNVAQTNIPVDLYATPNKLRTTRQGFDNYFSPVATKPTGTEGFQTSTPAARVQSPTNLAEELRNRLRLDNGVRSSGNSPISSGRSTPRLEPQQPRTRHSWASQNTEVPQTCADRIKPKTSLMDFKRLLLEHGKTGVTAPKKSAVELLKLSKNTPLSPTKPLSPTMNILDLSASPKTFATRRMIRQGNFGASSPVKNGSIAKHVSPRTGWRYNNIRTTDVISTAIPEVNSEEDSPNNSRKLPCIPPEPKVIIEEKVNIRDNIFLKTEENNFMKHEVKPSQGSLITRAQLQAQRAQFLLGNNNNNNNTTAPPTFTFSKQINKQNEPTAKTTATNSSPTTPPPPPSLETAL